MRAAQQHAVLQAAHACRSLGYSHDVGGSSAQSLGLLTEIPPSVAVTGKILRSTEQP